MSGVTQAVFMNQRSFAPPPPPATDPPFNAVVLLLHGDGTNGAQNNTFLDSSTNNFTITRNGNTTQGTFSPFSLTEGQWSNHFNGGSNSTNSEYLSYPANAALQMGTGQFWFEAWIWMPYAPAANDQYIVLGVTTGGATNALTVRIQPSALRVDKHGVLAYDSSSVTWQYQTWQHIAVGRDSGNTLRFFVNGNDVGTRASTTDNFSGSSNAIGLTPADNNFTSTFNGYISNLRLLKGTCLHTSSFTPPTSPLTAIANTSLLTCQSNRFVDKSTNAFAITSNNNVRVTPFSPFVPSAAYNASVNGGSGYFDGSGDYLSIADVAGLRFGTGNFTIQAWIYRSVAGAVHSIAAKGGASTGWVFQVHSDNKLRFTQTTTNIDSTGTIPASTWTHVAVVREGTGTNQTKLYINGVNAGQATVTTNFNQTEQLKIGADRGNGNVMNGYIAGFKYVVGTAEAITVPTAPPTGGTALLNFTNAGILDNTGKNNLETVGNAQIDTTTKKFGTGSLEFDGTGDWLVIADTPELRFETAPFTVEFWVYFNNSNSAVGLVSKGGSSTGWGIARTDTNNLRFNYGSSQLNSTATFSTSTWYYIAVVREGTGTNQTKMYIDGVNDGTATVTTNFNQTDPMYIGANRVAQAAANAFIDDLRITKGVARYTANFTAPTKAFPDQ